MADLSFHVEVCSFFAAPTLDQRDGLVGWVDVVVGGAVVIHRVAVRRTLDGRATLSFPRRRHGEHHVRPIDDEARVAIEAAVVADLRQQGRLAS